MNRSETTLPAQALAELQHLPTQGAQALLHQQARLSALQPPGWLQLAWVLHSARHEAAQQGITAAHLINAMSDFGVWCCGWPQTDEPDSECMAWYGDGPQAHLKRVGTHALVALGITEGIKLPDMSVHNDPYQHSTHIALRWLGQAAQRLSRHPPPDMPWGLPDAVEAVVGLQATQVRVLFQAGPSTGALGQLRLRAVHERGAHLRLVPMPTSLCLLLDADFGQALETVTQYLRNSLENRSDMPPLTDIALAWDLAPAAGEAHGFSSLHGNSAGAAFAGAALLALAPYAPPALRHLLQRAAPLLPNAFISAALEPCGHLQPVGGVAAKAQGFGPLAQALQRWAGSDPAASPRFYLASEQTLPNEALPLEPVLLGSMAELLSHLAQQASPLSPDQEAFLSQGFADPEQLAHALNDPAQRHDTEALLNRLVDKTDANPVRSVQQAAMQGVARWVRQAGGRLRHQFVPVQVQADNAAAKSLPPAALEPHEHLRDLLQLADDHLHLGYLLQGLPGAGKSVLLRRHMLECCENLLTTAPHAPADTPAQELPIYLPMDALTKADPPPNDNAAAWWKDQAQEHTKKTLAAQGWSPALVASLVWPPAATGLPRVRFLLDGLNELPMPSNAPYTRRERARWVVQGFLDAFGRHAHKPLLSVRSEHFAVLDCLPVDVKPWTPAHIQAYLACYFGPDRAAELWPHFAQDPVLLALCSRPMHLHMQCELVDAGYTPLVTDRASLYLAHLWLRLRRGLGLFGQRDTRQTPDEALNPRELLTENDRDLIERTQPGRIDADDLRELPTEGWLLRGLLQQAEHQYWGDTDQGKDSRERCSVSVRVQDIRLQDTHGQAMSPDLRKRWIDACAALGLLEKDGPHRVKFSHQSWGEFFASLRLLDTPPDQLEQQVKHGVPGAQEKWQRAMVRPFAHLDEPVSAEQARQALRERVNQRWAAAVPLLKALLQQNQGQLWVSMDSFKADGNMQQYSDEAVQQRYEPTDYVQTGILQFDTVACRVGADLKCWAEKTRLSSELGLVASQHWADEPSAWQALLINRVFGCFRNLVWQHLRAGCEQIPGFSEEALQQLQEEPGYMHPPSNSDVQEVLNLALQGLPPSAAQAWLTAWLARPPHSQAWRVLAPAALALRPRLEPPQAPAQPQLLPTSGVARLGLWHQPNPVLQHLRRWLLLASLDAGPAALPRVQAAQLVAALAKPVAGLPPGIESAWHTQRQTAFQTPGLDLLLRLQAGLLLGELGDNIRYEPVSVQVPAQNQPGPTQVRTGIRLRAAHWAHIPASGPDVIHRIGNNSGLGRYSNNHPAWTVADGELPESCFAHTPVVVMQWQAYVDDLAAQGQTAPRLWAMDQPRWNNPLQPITSLTWYQAQAFTAWAAPLHTNLFPGCQPLALPTEVQHEAAVRFDPATPKPTRQALWPHDPRDSTRLEDMPPDLFNHNRTRWGAPAPVGVFSAALTPSGIEVMGNVWTWCSNGFTENYQERKAQQAANKSLMKDDVCATDSPPLALRGGSFYSADYVALADHRNIFRPALINYIGLRWQLSCATPWR